MLMRAFYRSHLLDAVKREALLLKIKTIYSGKPNAIVFEQGKTRIKSEKLTSVTITEGGTTGAIVYVDPNGVIAALKAIQDLTYTAKAKGLGGNDISVTYVDPVGLNAALSVSVVGSAITVNLATDGSSAPTSTAAQIKDAIDNDAAASALVSVAVSGTGATVQAAQVLTALTGGSDTATFDVADIQMIQRIRSRKYKFVLKEDANPAA